VVGRSKSELHAVLSRLYSSSGAMGAGGMGEFGGGLNCGMLCSSDKLLQFPALVTRVVTKAL